MLTWFSFALRRMALRAGASIVGAILMLVGLGFFTVALWILLVEMRDPLFAATVLGGIYLGVGLIVLALAMRHPRRKLPYGYPPAAPAPPAGVGAAGVPGATMPGLMGALMQGVGAGMAAGAARRQPPPE
ncbi:phage holin family protein [Pseudooceanicola marinus]|uniref:phage holin family protein n=1 Tax=Pseudooceanicola marinus TaxID=396013 RepID=UPI001C94D0F0|nr:phage holin family protein [Pseudooceanicola marinus]MBY5972028.1 phage holin family protein [Ferrimonas balearica]MCA1335132.1 phage holin family protein [Pseudooceanicola marinus]